MIPGIRLFEWVPLTTNSYKLRVRIGSGKTRHFFFYPPGGGVLSGYYHLRSLFRGRCLQNVVLRVGPFRRMSNNYISTRKFRFSHPRSKRPWNGKKNNHSRSRTSSFLHYLLCAWLWLAASNASVIALCRDFSMTTERTADSVLNGENIFINDSDWILPEIIPDGILIKNYLLFHT